MFEGTMKSSIEKLLSELCVDWGFCIPPDDEIRLLDSQYLEADDFARAILVAEGMNPDYEINWRRRIRRMFTDRFGSSAIRESDFRDSAT